MGSGQMHGDMNWTVSLPTHRFPLRCAITLEERTSTPAFDVRNISGFDWCGEKGQDVSSKRNHLLAGRSRDERHVHSGEKAV